MRIGVLTGGGDCPGLNAVIRAVVRKGVSEYGYEFVGFRDGWRGPLEGDTMPLDIQAVRGILPARRHHPRLLAHQPASRSRAASTRIKENLAAHGRRRAHRDRRRGHPRRRQRSSTSTASTWSACPRPSTTTCRPPTTPSASTPRSTSPRRPSTACTPPPSPTTAPWSSRSWAATRAGSRCTRAWRAAPTSSSSPSSPFDIDQVVRLRRVAASRPATRRSSWSPRARTRSEGQMALQARRARLVRPRAARRHRRVAGQGDREAHRQGGPHHRPRPRPARRHPHAPSTGCWPPASGLHAIDAVHERRLRQDGRPARHRHRPRRPVDEATAELKTVPVVAVRGGRGLLRLIESGLQAGGRSFWISGVTATTPSGYGLRRGESAAHHAPQAVPKT